MIRLMQEDGLKARTLVGALWPHTRLPAPIGYVPPVECEEQYYRRQEAPATLAGVT